MDDKAIEKEVGRRTHPCGCEEVTYRHLAYDEERIQVDPCIGCSLSQAGYLLQVAGEKYAKAFAPPGAKVEVVGPRGPHWTKLARDKTGMGEL